MVTMRWAEKQPGIPKKAKVIITKDDGTELELIASHVSSKNNEDTFTKGDCITVPRSSVPNECHIGEVTGFRFTGDSQPTGIFWRRWRMKEQNWGSRYDLDTYNTEEFNKISKIECPVECNPQNGGKRKTRRKNKKNI